MPIYQFACDSCNHSYEEFFGLKEKMPQKCPACKVKKGFRRVFDVPNAIVRGSPKTFGQAAEENAKRVGKAGLESMAQEDKTRLSKAGFSGKLPKGASINKSGTGAIPPWRDGSMGTERLDKPLNLATIKDAKKYVERGVK